MKGSMRDFNKKWGKDDIIEDAEFKEVETVSEPLNRLHRDQLLNAINEGLGRDQKIVTDEPVHRSDIQATINNYKNTNLENTLTEAEKRAWIDKFKAMQSGEKEIALSCFTTDELYDEIGRRLKKFSTYISDIKNLVDSYEGGQ